MGWISLLESDQSKIVGVKREGQVIKAPGTYRYVQTVLGFTILLVFGRF